MATVEQLLAELASGDPPSRRAAVETLSTLSADAQPAAVALVDCAGEAALIDTASGALEELGPPATRDLPALAERLKSPSGDTAYWAATLLGRAGHAAAPHAGELVAAVTSDRAPLAARERAAWALARLGPIDAATAAPIASFRVPVDAPRFARLVQDARRAMQG